MMQLVSNCVCVCVCWQQQQQQQRTSSVVGHCSTLASQPVHRSTSLHWCRLLMLVKAGIGNQPDTHSEACSSS